MFLRANGLTSENQPFLGFRLWSARGIVIWWRNVQVPTENIFETNLAEFLIAGPELWTRLRVYTDIVWMYYVHSCARARLLGPRRISHLCDKHIRGYTGTGTCTRARTPEYITWAVSRFPRKSIVPTASVHPWLRKYKLADRTWTTRINRGFK